MYFKDFALTMLEKAFLCFYLAITTLAYYGQNGGFPWNLCYYIWVFITGLAGVYWFITGEFRNLKMLGKWTLLYSGSFLLMMFLSLSLWVFSVEPLDRMLKATQRVYYNLFAVIGASASIYLLGSDAIVYSFYAMIGANSLILLNVVRQYGFGTVISGFFRMVTTAFSVDIPVMRALEIHDLTYAIGYYLVYFWINRKKVKHAWILMGVGGFFFLLGFKRMGAGGVMAGLAVYYVLNLFKTDRSRRRACLTASAILMAMCVGYVIFIRSGLFNAVMDAAEVNTMGRSKIYRLFEPYYEISPSFMGNGMSFVTNQMAEFSEMGMFGHTLLAIHSDVLAFYIELGFWGYLAWLGFDLLLRTKVYIDDFGAEKGLVYMAVMVAMFTTYFTDNTYLYPYSNVAFRILTLGLACEGMACCPPRRKLAFS